MSLWNYWKREECTVEGVKVNFLHKPLLCKDQLAIRCAMLVTQ